jgi:hypothetical protein
LHNKSNLVVPNENTTAIQINVNNVTIDLNGFAILGPNVCATDGVSVCAALHQAPNRDGHRRGHRRPVENTRVMNGTIDGMGNIGIFANVNARVEKMNVSVAAASALTRLVASFSILSCGKWRYRHRDDGRDHPPDHSV